jgi:hypothetical protein
MTVPMMGEVPKGWQEVTSGVAVAGDRAWSEVSRAYIPVVSWLGTPACNFWRLIRRSRPQKEGR